MINFTKILTVSDIQTRDILFYDSEIKDICYQFCQLRDIDCLPSLEDPTRIYIRYDDRPDFYSEEIPEEQWVDGTTPIFSPEMLQKFNKPLLMVRENGRLSGVLHFSDYNHPAVNTYLFEMINAFERALRKYLVNAGLTDQTMIAYLQGKLSKEKKESSRKELEKTINSFLMDPNKKRLQPFETFYLLNLICLANHHLNLQISDEINKLRNQVAHGHDLVNLEDTQAQDYIYDRVSFTVFFTRTQTLQDKFKKLMNRIAFQAQVK